MSERTKNILSWILTILFIGGAITSLIINPGNFFMYCLWIIVAIIAIVILVYIWLGVKHVMYEIINNRKFQRLYRRYISKHYESR